MKKIKGRPDEVSMDEFFGKDNKEFNSFYGTYPTGLKVPGKPEIIFPKSTYDPIVGASIRGLQNGETTGTIRVDTIPTGAEFFIVTDDGNETSFGTTAQGLTITDVDVGSYNYIIKLIGYDDYNGVAEVKAGQICCINIDLELKTASDKCSAQPTGNGKGNGGEIPPSVQGYVVVRERDITYIFGGLMLLAGLVIGYFLLKKE